MAIENVVIAYLADISDIKRSVTQISTINKQLATKMGADFSKGFTVISSQLKKLQFDKQFKIKIEGGKGFKKLTGTVSTFEKVIRTADGQVFKFTETIGKSGKTTTTLATSINKVAVAQSKLGAVTSQTATKFSSFKNINSTFSKQLGSFGNVTKLVGTSLNQLSDSGSKISKIFQTANGKFVQLTQTTTRLPSGVNKVTRSIKELSKAQAQNARVIERNNKPTKSFAQNLKALAGRALLTIPVWFALRTSISGVFRTIRDGLKNLAEFDRALQKLSRNLEATSTNLAGDFAKVQKVINDFSLKTGKSVVEITNAIQKFATVGFDLETSIAGGLNATKLAITLFGEAEETAQAFARAMRVLTEDMDDSKEKSLEIAKAMALTDKLWQTNAFEVSEFSANLTKFAGTAKIANLSIQDTLAILATLSTAGLDNRAGRLLRSTLLRALADIPKIVKGLDLDFDPDNQSTIVFIELLVAKLKELRVTGNVPAELASTLGELFTIRGTEVLAGLVALEKTLKANLALKPDLEEFEKTFEGQLIQVNRLVERHKNLNKEMGKAFVTGLLGAGNYQKALQGIVNVQEKLIDDTETLGNGIRNAFAIGGTLAVLAFRSQLLKLFALTANPIIIVIASTLLLAKIVTDVQRLADEAIKQDKAFLKVGEKFSEQINKGIRGKLDLRSLETLVFVLEEAGAGDNFGFNIDEGAFNSLLSTLKEILEVQRDTVKEQKNLTVEAKKTEIADKKKLEIAEIVLKNQLELLKARGANESTIIKATQLIRKQLNLEVEDLEVLKEKLAIERSINDEKRLENKLISDTSQKLAEIGRTEGIDVASKIGDVLSGDIDFRLFERLGGRPLEVFKEKFNDIFQQQQDIKFLDTKGFRIPLELADQTTVRGNQGRIRTLASIEQSRAEAFIKSLEKSSIEINTNSGTTQENTEALKQLRIQFERTGQILAEDIVTARQGGIPRNLTLREQNIQAVQARVVPQTIPPVNPQSIDFNITIDGQNLNLSFTTREEARAILTNVLSDPNTIDRIVNSLQFKEKVIEEIEEF